MSEDRKYGGQDLPREVFWRPSATELELREPTEGTPFCKLYRKELTQQADYSPWKGLLERLPWLASESPDRRRDPAFSH